jgi:hypothetical protein
MPYHLRRRDDDTWEAFDRLDSAFEWEPMLATPDEVVRLDLREVRGVSSGGLQRLMTLIRTTKEQGRRIRFIACPIDLVDAFNNIATMGAPYAEIVESFQAPYECANCLKERIVLLSVDEARSRPKPDVAPARRCASCGAPMAFPVGASEYFGFLDGE